MKFSNRAKTSFPVLYKIDKNHDKVYSIIWHITREANLLFNYLFYYPISI